MLVLGFDPGGIGQFGWCVAESRGNHRIRIHALGTADSAAQAHERTLVHIRDRTQIVAAGIDSPLFWVANGDREADKIIRKVMTDLGAPRVHGTVQQVNSLRGACLAQGIMAAHLLRREMSTVRLTETHPKALLWLLKVATKERRVLDVTTEHLVDFVECDSSLSSEHERDAVLGALGAFAMVREAPGWRNLVQYERDPFIPVAPVEYWMPIPPRHVT